MGFCLDGSSKKIVEQIRKMSDKEKVLNIIPTANLVVNYWSIEIWSGCGQGCLASIKRDIFLGGLDKNFCIETAWKSAWIGVQQKMLEKLES
jgi:hypothetical protein